MCHHVPCAIPYYTFGRSTVVLRQSEVSAGGQPLKLRYLNPLTLSKGSYMMSFAAVALCLLGMCRCSVAYSVTSLKTTKSFQLHIQPSDTYGENNFGAVTNLLRRKSMNHETTMIVNFSTTATTPLTLV